MVTMLCDSAANVGFFLSTCFGREEFCPFVACTMHNNVCELIISVSVQIQILSFFLLI